MATDMIQTTPMTLELTGLPESVVQQVHKLVQAALHETSETHALDRMLDTDYFNECAADTSPEPTVAEVRAALGKITGSLAQDIIANRDER